MAIGQQTLAVTRDLRVAVGSEADQATRSVTKDWADGWEQVAPLYATALTGLAAQATAAGEWPGPWLLARDPALQQANQQTQTVLTGLAAGTVVATTTSATNAAQATVEAEPQAMATQLPPPEQGNALAVFVAAVAAVGVAELLAGLAAAITPGALVTTAGSAINRALVRGVSIDAAPETVGRKLLGNVRDGFMAGLTSAITGVRTDTLDAYRLAARMVHDANRLWVQGWIWQCSLDRRTCPSCWAMHGTFHPAAEPGPADHPQGRCARVVKLRPWVRLGIGGDEPADRITPARAKFDALPKADQLRILGPARLDLLQAGRIDWDDLATLRHKPGRRSAYVPRTVADLQSLARARAA